MENLVNIGTIVGTHHLTGSVKVSSIFQDTYLIIGEKVLLEKGDERKILLVKNVKILNNKKIIIDFSEINDIDAAKELNGFQIKIRRDLLPEKNENEFYLKDVMETAAHNILIVEDTVNKNEIMIPQVDEFVKKIDFENNRIDVELIEGMRE